GRPSRTSPDYQGPAAFSVGAGLAREAGDAVPGTGFAGVRGHARSHRDGGAAAPEATRLRKNRQDVVQRIRLRSLALLSMVAGW
ncbi:hypothetical protein C1X72_06680, partial [Pseudomonas sp. FW306-2-2C-D06B]